MLKTTFLESENSRKTQARELLELENKVLFGQYNVKAKRFHGTFLGTVLNHGLLCPKGNSNQNHHTAPGMCQWGQMLNSPISITNCHSKWHKESSQQLEQSVLRITKEVVPVLMISLCAFRIWSEQTQSMWSLSFLTQLCCINLLGLGDSQDH